MGDSIQTSPEIILYGDGNAEFAGTVTADNVTFDAGTVDEVNVKTRLASTKSALEAIKAAAQDTNTDLAGLKAAIVSALANI